jgi:hypothetical protein
MMIRKAETLKLNKRYPQKREVYIKCLSSKVTDNEHIHIRFSIKQLYIVLEIEWSSGEGDSMIHYLKNSL